MPVLPEVGSTSTVLPGVARPAASSPSIMARPMRSLTELSGLKNSSLARSSAVIPARSEEHTSELQSLMRNSYAGFCLKKKNHLRAQQRAISIYKIEIGTDS